MEGPSQGLAARQKSFGCSQGLFLLPVVCWFSSVIMQGQAQGEEAVLYHLSSGAWRVSSPWTLARLTPGSGLCFTSQVTAQTHKNLSSRITGAILAYIWGITESCAPNSCYLEPEGKIRIDSYLKMKQGGRKKLSCLSPCHLVSTRQEHGHTWACTGLASHRD